MSTEGGWMLHAHAKSKGDVKAELEKARTETVDAAKEAGDGLDKGIIEQMDVAIEAAGKVARLFKGRSAIDMQVAGSSHENNLRLVIVASRGGGSE